MAVDQVAQVAVEVMEVAVVGQAAQVDADRVVGIADREGIGGPEGADRVGAGRVATAVIQIVRTMASLKRFCLSTAPRRS